MTPFNPLVILPSLPYSAAALIGAVPAFFWTSAQSFMEVLRSVGAKKDREHLFHILEDFILPKRKPDEWKKKKKCVWRFTVWSLGTQSEYLSERNREVIVSKLVYEVEVLFFFFLNTNICSTSVCLRGVFFYRFLLFLRSWNMQKKGFYVFIST